MGFELRYSGYNPEEGIEIRSLSESLAGFGELSKEIIKSGYVSGDIEVRIGSVREGSVIVDVILQSREVQELFQSTEEFLNFAKIVAPEYYAQLQEQISSFGNSTYGTWKTIEAFARENPIAGSFIGMGIYDLLKIGFKTIGSYEVKNKAVELIADSEMVDIGSGKKVSGAFLKHVKKIVESGKSERFLEPLTEERIQNIRVGTIAEYEEINDSNFENFIGKGDEILPEFLNGREVLLEGSFTGMQSNHGETMTFKSSTLKDKRGAYFLFSCFLPAGRTTEDFKDFYGESKLLAMSAEVLRTSAYKKPKLIVRNLAVIQQTIF